MVIAALIVGGAGVWERTQANTGGDARADLRAIDGSELRSVDDGDAVLVPATVTAGAQAAAPISGDEVAWWSVQRRLHTSVETEDCTFGDGGERSCTPVTRANVEDADVEHSGSLAVQVEGDEKVRMLLTVPASHDALRLVDEHDTTREESATGGSDWIDATEYVLEDGAAVTIAGRRSGSREAPTIRPIDGVPLVFGGTPAQALRELDADARVGGRWIGAGAVLLVLGVGVFLGGRARAHRLAPIRAAERATALEVSRQEADAARERADAARADYEATLERQRRD